MSVSLILANFQALDKGEKKTSLRTNLSGID